MIKKLLTILFAFALFLTLVSCDKSEDLSEKSAKEKGSPSITTTESEEKNNAPSSVTTTKNEEGEETPKTTTPKQTENEPTFPSAGNGEIDLPAVGID